MRAGASVGLRIATAVAFGATAALAVTLNRGVPVHAALTSEKGRSAPHATTTASSPASSPAASPAATPRCASSGLRICVGAGSLTACAAHAPGGGDYLRVYAIRPGSGTGSESAAAH